MDKSKNGDNEKRTILPHQRDAFNHLNAVARVCFSVNRESLPVKLRTNCLIIGPSGSGKTYLARAVAEEMEVPFLSISISDWMLIGGTKRGALATWPGIYDFLCKCKNKGGAIIFIDEIDKLNNSSSYVSFLLTELYSLLDYRIPWNLADSEGDSIATSLIAEAQDILSTKTLLLAGGAFQHIWDTHIRPTMGFLNTEDPDELPDLLDLSTTLPRELVSRFRSRLTVLPRLVETDYHQMLEIVARKVPDVWRSRFHQLGHERISSACRLQQGPRFLEELMLDTILQERAALVTFRKEEIQPQHTGHYLNSRHPCLSHD